VYGLVHDANGNPSYAMRFIQGETLKDAIDRYHQSLKQKWGLAPQDAVPVPIFVSGSRAGERAVQFRQLLSQFIGVCNTIAYAHTRAIIHRDLKPGNIILGKFGESIVVDWGMARHIERTEEARAGGEETVRPTLGSDSHETRQGDVKGTVAYMSPEQ